MEQYDVIVIGAGVVSFQNSIHSTGAEPEF